MNLTEEVSRLIKEPARDEDAIHDRLFWRLVDICLEMAKRIEALQLTARTVPPHCYTVHFDKETEEHLCRQAELERLRDMLGMVREAGEKPQTREEVRVELERLRELFDMEKEAGE